MKSPKVTAEQNSRRFRKVVLAIHGGAGTITREKTPAADEQKFLSRLEDALQAGYSKLEKGLTSLDAVEAAVRYLEDCPLFNAGRGAVFNHDGRIDLDAAIMNGATRGAGAVAAVRTIRNPVSAARAVMEQSAHVMLIGQGAEDFAASVGLKLVDPEYFVTPRQRKQFEKALETERRGQIVPRGKLGTVGAVALDDQGNLAAATSTGGMFNKRWGRVGDSPVIGAGTYADNETCAVSATGHGEYFMRLVVAHDLSCRMRYLGEPLLKASRAVVHGELSKLGGEGGLIALDARGNCALPFNSEGMYRGCITENGEAYVAIFN